MHRISLALLLFVVADVAPAWAQVDFRALRVEPGDRVRITQPSGVEVAGVVTEVTPGLLNIADYAFKPEPGLRVDRLGDSVLTGGTLVGVGVGALLISVTGVCYVQTLRCLASGLTIYGGLGALVDYFHQGHTTVFRGRPAARSTSTGFAPVVTRNTKAIVLSVGF